jgi:rubrerythrin
MTMYRPLVSRALVEDIRKAINGEYSAIQCYEKLAKSAPNQDIREQIDEIRQDEITHFKAFTHIYYSLTGQQPQPEIIEDCPDEFRASAIAAFKDEQKTVDFYLGIAEEAQNPYIRQIFTRAAADEQNHAVWFLSFITLK